jgi:hypothetical protein
MYFAIDVKVPCVESDLRSDAWFYTIHADQACKVPLLKLTLLNPSKTMPVPAGAIASNCNNGPDCHSLRWRSGERSHGYAVSFTTTDQLHRIWITGDVVDAHQALVTEILGAVRVR